MLHRKLFLRWRAFIFLGMLIAFNFLLFFLLIDGSEPPLATNVAYAQDDNRPEDKIEPVDSYPNPFEEGALPFSLRDPWDKTDLTYFFHNCPSTVSCGEGQNAVRIGFQKWANVSALTFTEVSSAAQADIEVQWTTDYEELGEPGGVLAFAYFPRYGGDLFIDDIERWTIGDGSDMDLILVATHEIGHAIGLAHSEFQSAIMFPYSGFSSDLGQDDINAVQALYGPPDSSTPPPNVEPETPAMIPNVADNVDQVEGQITPDDPYNVWDLEVEDRVTVTVTMETTGGDLDPYVGILTEDLSAVLVENSDNDGDGIAVVAYTFDEGGLFKIVATRFGVWDGTTTGPYTLTAAFDAESDPGTPPENPSIPSDPQNVTWRVTNYSGNTICFIYFSPSDSTNWGDDQLGADQTLADNFYLEWQAEAGTYDIRVEDCSQNFLEQYTIDLSRNIDIQVYGDRILVVPLTTTPTTTTDDSTFTWRVSNFSSAIICRIYFGPSTQQNWGEDQLGNDILNMGFYIDWALETGSYDIRIETCVNQVIEKFNIPLAQDVEVQVFDGTILVEPLR